MGVKKHGPNLEVRSLHPGEQYCLRHLSRVLFHPSTDVSLQTPDGVLDICGPLELARSSYKMLEAGAAV